MHTTILFDIDGTLLLTGGVGATAFDLAFADLFQIDAAWGDTTARGKTDPGLIDEISSRTLGRSLSSDEFTTLKSTYINYFESSLQNSENFRLLPGAKELVALLSGMESISLGIETGNFKETAMLKLGWRDLDSSFSFGGYACDSENRSEIVRIALERSPQFSTYKADTKAVVIGDALTDIQAARDNNIQAVLVLTGGVDAESARNCGADLVLDNLNQQEKLLQFLSLY